MQLEKLWQFMQVDMEADRFEAKIRQSEKRQKLLKQRNFLMEQQTNMKKLENDVAVMQDRLEAVNEEAQRLEKLLSNICAEIEAEVAELDDEERTMFLEELGIEESGLDKLIKASYSLLNLISFLTAGEDECRAWTIKRGTKAPGAAGKIHTDFEKGFIRAETISYDKLMEVGGSLAAAKEKGFIRSEGKEYVMNDGDVVNFLFNV